MADLRAILSALEAVKPYQGDHMARCPAHDDKTQSLSVKLTNDHVLLNCFANCAFPIVESALIARGVPREAFYPVTEKAFAPTLKARETLLASYEYRDEKRQLQFVVERHRTDTGKTFRVKRPDGKGGWIHNRQGVAPVPYRLGDVLMAKPDDVIFVCEGEKDCDVAAGHSLYATTNPHGAGKWTADLNKYFAGRRVAIIPDNDEPGRQHAESVAAQLRPVAAAVAILALPNLPPKGDLADWIAAGGTADDLLTRASKAFRSAQSDAQPSVLKFSDVLAGVLGLHRTGIPRGESTGFQDLDEFFTIKRGYFTVINGIPGNGKSTFTDAVLCNLIRRNWRVAVLSLEAYPVDFYVATLAARYIGKPFNEGATARVTTDELRDLAAGGFNDRLRLLNPSEEQCTVDGVIALVKKMHATEQLDAVLIDPWNELNHAAMAQTTEAIYLQDSLRKLRRMARDIDAHLFVVAHPRLLQKRDDGGYGVPTPYDLAGGAMWRNKADCCLCVWRDLDPSRNSRILEVYVQKVKNRYIGREGRALLYYDPAIGTYTSVPRDYKATDDYIRAIGGR
jgi:twinkle protein